MPSQPTGGERPRHLPTPHRYTSTATAADGNTDELLQLEACQLVLPRLHYRTMIISGFRRSGKDSTPKPCKWAPGSVVGSNPLRWFSDTPSGSHFVHPVEEQLTDIFEHRLSHTSYLLLIW